MVCRSGQMAPLRSLSTLSVCILLLSFATAQSCYFPDGSPMQSSNNAYPCTSEYADKHDGTSTTSNSICCPLGWACLENGLCRLSQAGLQIQQPATDDNWYGRYGCANSNWDNCIDICIDDTSEGGNEAVLQCSQGVWCCDRDRTHGNCCTGTVSGNNPAFFQIVGNTTVGQAAASGGGSAPAPSSSSQVQGTSRAPATTAPPTVVSSTPEVATQISYATGAEGAVRTVKIIVTEAPQPGSSTASHIGVIVGCALGIPLILAILGILLFIYLQRRRHYKRASLDAATNKRAEEYPEDDPHAAPYMRSLGTVWNPSEADSLPVLSPSARHSRHGSEMDMKRADGSPGTAHTTPVPPYEELSPGEVHELHGDEKFRS